jgi:hypothetical protein
MKQLNIKSGTTCYLGNLEYKDIFLRRVESPNNEFRQLMSVIQIVSEYPDGRKVSTPFHPNTYASIYNARAVTNDFVKVIRNCSYKNLVLDSFDKDFELILFYEQAKFRVDTITISVVRQIDGTTYSLHPKSNQEIHQQFEGVQTIRSVFISLDVHIDFQLVYGPVYWNVIETLTGLNDENLNYVRDIIFFEPSTGAKRFSLYNEKGE